MALNRGWPSPTDSLSSEDRMSGDPSETMTVPSGATGRETHPQPPRFRRWQGVLVLLLLLATAAVYAPVRHFDFVNYDDPEYVTANPHVQSGLTWRNVIWALHTGHASNWHPVTWWSHMLDAQLFGAAAAGPHLVNLFFHLLNTGLLLLLLFRLTGAFWRSLGVAAFFALHPLHVESVAWIAERKDVLSACFGLLATLCYVGRVEWQRAGNARAAAKYYGLAWLLFALGLMSKPMLVTLPLVWVLLDYWPLARLNFSAPRGFLPALGKLLAEKWMFLAASAVSCVITFRVQQAGQAVRSLEALPLDVRVETVFMAGQQYLTKLLWPANLACLYPHPGHWPGMKVAIAAAALLGITLWALGNGRRWRFLPVGWFWCLGMLVPVIGLVQVGQQYMADRYTYLPAIGIFILVSWGTAALVDRWRALWLPASAVGLAVLVACSLQTRRQLGYWQDSGALFQHALAVTSDNFTAYNNLGQYRFAQGDSAAAIAAYQKALEIHPGYAVALNNLGVAYSARGEFAAAIQTFETALQMHPDAAELHYDFGNTLVRCGRWEEGVREYQQAVQLAPSARTYNNLGVALTRQKQWAEAAISYRHALELEPGNAEVLNNLGSALLHQQQYAGAVDCYQQALQVNPDQAETHYNLALALARLGRNAEALPHYELVVRQQPDRAAGHDNYGIALAGLGRWEEAVREFAAATRLQPDNPRAHLRLAAALLQAGRKEAAATEAHEALRLQPDFPEARQLLQQLETPAGK